jgi:hypothetical protein
VITEPLSIGFKLVAPTQDEVYSAVYILSFVVDSLFGVDIVLTTFTSIETEIGEEILSLRAIWKRYFPSLNFAVDLLSFVPIDLIVVCLHIGSCK